MMRAIEKALYGGTQPVKCARIRKEDVDRLARTLGRALRRDVPGTDEPKNLPLAKQTRERVQTVAARAMAVIKQRYPSTGKADVSKFMEKIHIKTKGWWERRLKELTTPPNYATRAQIVGEALSHYAAWKPELRALAGPLCLGGYKGFWRHFASWLAGTSFTLAFTNYEVPAQDESGRQWDRTFGIGRRLAFFETYLASGKELPSEKIWITQTKDVAVLIPLVVHEMMHDLVHKTFMGQMAALNVGRDVSDVFVEGMAEYLARGVLTEVTSAVGTALGPVDGKAVWDNVMYEDYYKKIITLRDILYSHGQDGDAAIRRAYFFGEIWRLGLLGQRTDSKQAVPMTSPVETDRPIPEPRDVHFAYAKAAIKDPGRLDEIVHYLRGRSNATAEVVGRTDERGSRDYNAKLGLNRAETVKAYLVAKGVETARISVDSTGEDKPIPKGRRETESQWWRKNRSATVTVIDPYNRYPGMTYNAVSRLLQRLLLWWMR